MLDYHKWIDRAVAFTQSLHRLPGTIEIDVRADPPALKEEVETLARRLRLMIPPSFSNFLVHGSSHCACRYWWRLPAYLSQPLKTLLESDSKTFLWGGAQLCDIESLPYEESGLLDQGVQYAEGTQDRDYWLNSVPIVSVNNGDYVALYMGSSRPSQDYPVVYLNHDGYSTGTVLAPSFDRFLMNWESLDYIGSDLMFFFLDASGSIIVEKRDFLHQLFLDGLSHS